MTEENDPSVEYFDIKNREDLIDLSIQKADAFNCKLIHEKEDKIYKWFLLSQSPRGRAYTLCETDFHKDTQEGKYQARLTFRKVDKNLEDKALRSDIAFIRMPFQTGEDGYREFWKMVWFLYGFRELIDTGDFKKSYNITSTDAYIVSFNDQAEAERVESLSRLLTEGKITEADIRQALEGRRKATLEEFRKLLTIEHYWRTYGIKGWEEAVWHHFLKTNNWILWLNADLRFIRDLISEPEVWNPNSMWRGSPKVDIMGISDYTVLIELKTSHTKIFTAIRWNTSRANTWSFSSDFIDGISQCLGQKSDLDKNHQGKGLINASGEEIDQRQHRTVDPKCIFLIGCKHHEMPEGKHAPEIHIKRDTFQRYVRNSRNVEILTFDELYIRSYFTVYNEKPDFSFLEIENAQDDEDQLSEVENAVDEEELTYSYSSTSRKEDIHIEDIPF